MSPTVLLAAIVFGGAIFFLIWNLMPQKQASLLEERLGNVAVVNDPSMFMDADEAELAKPLSERLLLPLMNSIGRFMMKRTKGGQLDILRKKITAAGSKQKPETLLALKVIMAPVGLGVGLALVSVMGLGSPLNIAAPFGLMFLGYAYPTSSLSGKIKKRAKEIRLSLPGNLDLLTISMEAGLSLDMAIMRVSESEESLLATEFQKVINEIRLGRPRMEALTAMAERNDVEEMTTFIRAIVQAEPLGVSIANVLRIQSEELRRLRRQRAEEAGHRAPVLMLMPMMGCIFPCIFIILLGPAVISVMKSMGAGS